MDQAIDLARGAAAAGEVPVGAVVLVAGEVVAARANEREATLVVTLEPCPMCAGAVWAAQVGRVVFGAADAKAGAMGSLYLFATDPRLNHATEVVAGLRADECAELLRAFFAARR